jgi:excinuclease ABC subunit C
MKADLKDHIQSLPDSPGVYRFYDQTGSLIYVGKAKNIKKRVSSYFAKTSGVSRKTLRLVTEITKIEYTVAGSEFDALLLENNLIKENQPKYNILLKDDKTFPYICILKERFPRIIYTRKYIKSQGEYFGPYSTVVVMKNVLELIRKLYTIRTCNFLLSESNIQQGKFKVCLEYHLGNCMGPCEGKQSEEDYNEEIRQARHILKGNLSIVEKHLIELMDKASIEMQFERAQNFKNKLEALDRFQTKSLVVNRSITDIDVISITSNPLYAYVNYMIVREGSIVYSKSVELKKKIDEPDEELLSLAFGELRVQAGSQNSTILTNIPLLFMPTETENTIPMKGDKKKLVSLSFKNAMGLQQEKELLRSAKKTKRHEALVVLQNDLQLKAAPMIIECFDNSNLQGSSPVASLVRFVNGKPEKRSYRHFNIKTVEGSDDFASMREIVFRRYKRLSEQDEQLPDLVLVDGGKGQLSSAVDALKELQLYGKIPIAGIAKKLEEIYLPGDSLPVMINKKSISLKLLQQIRDEAHRFAITFHRSKQEKKTMGSQLDDLPGIGEKTATKLLKHFKSVRKIKNASIEELESIVGKAKAEKLKGLK